MKKNIFRLIKLTALFAAVAASAAFLQEFVLCRADHNRQRVKGFYQEQKDSLDVVFLGASEVYSDIAPGYASTQFGLTSYLFATQANSILNYKSQLKNILSRQNPDLIVVELNGALYEDDEEVKKEANLRNYADNVPLDGIKAEWIAQNGSDNPLEYAFPLIKYHDAWKNFPSEMKYQATVWHDHTRGYTYLKGMLNETAVCKPSQRTMNRMLAKSANSKKPITETEEAALRDLLEYCKSENLQNVVFARFPHLVVKRTFSRFERGNTVGDIVREYGFDFYNFEQEFDKTGLDEATDFYNLDHLNVYGQRKFTDYLLGVLSEKHKLSPDALSDSEKAEWNACASYYDAYYRYSDSLIRQGVTQELSEDVALIETLNNFM